MLALTLSACGKPEINVDPEIRPFYDKFVELGKGMGVDVSKHDISIRFVPSLTPESPGTVLLGICYYDDDEVKINREAWNKMSVEKKDALIAHELGHCILERDHENSTDSLSGKKLSIMNSFIISDSDFKTRYDYYMRELFRPEDKNFLASLWDQQSVYTSPIVAKIAALFGVNLTEESTPEEEIQID
jgi:hypothetical protein